MFTIKSEGLVGGGANVGTLLRVKVSSGYYKKCLHYARHKD